MPGNRFRGLTFHVIGRNHLIEALCSKEGGKIEGLDLADIVIWQGGVDVNPKLYGETCHPQTQNPDRMRDTLEAAIYHQLSKQQYKVGICRGAQFLNVMNNGKLWQHIEGHGAPHDMSYIMENDAVRGYLVSSTHHQMMIPCFPDGVVWGFANQTRTRQMPDGQTIQMSDKHWKDAEIVYYNRTKSLCFQPHPEYSIPKDTKELFIRCVNRMLEH